MTAATGADYRSQAAGHWIAQVVIVLVGLAHLTSCRRHFYGGPRFHQQWHVWGGLRGIAGLFPTIGLADVLNGCHTCGSQPRGEEPLQELIGTGLRSLLALCSAVYSVFFHFRGRCSVAIRHRRNLDDC